MSDNFNMSMRKFLKQVGVTSQQAIEDKIQGAQRVWDLDQEHREAVHEAGREERDRKSREFWENVLAPAMEEAYEHFKTLPPCTDPTCSEYKGDVKDAEGDE